MLRSPYFRTCFSSVVTRRTLPGEISSYLERLNQLEFETLKHRGAKADLVFYLLKILQLNGNSGFRHTTHLEVITDSYRSYIVEQSTRKLFWSNILEIGTFLSTTL